jgi:peptidoglycan/LPS O-acetylase OafA/YrhL
LKPELSPPAALASKYRPDIDGLRALAVLAVLFYHAQLGCPGGFVGVDVFFVISGYLITSLISDELANGTFSLMNFWERRIRRIVPAALAMTLGVFFAASLWFLPGDFSSVCKSIAYQAILGANFFFWQQSGYFAPGAETQPLLHTWSLAVEEQFYLLFPPLLIVLARYGQRILLAGILAVTALSFAESATADYSPDALKTTFFLLPGRAWELLLGALLATARGRIFLGGATREILSGLGLALIVWPIFFYSTTTRFPGISALPPCFGAALIIFSSEAKLSTVGSILSFRPIVFIGLISYSLYLWHWPLLAFAKYSSKDQVATMVRVGLLVASFILAIISWQWIEKPFRQRRIFNLRREIFGFAGLMLVMLLSLGLALDKPPALVLGNLTAHASGRLNHLHARFALAEKKWEKHILNFNAAGTNPPAKVVIWGDSHARAMAPVIDMLCQEKNWQDMAAIHDGTPPVLWGSRPDNSVKRAALFSETVFKYIAQTHPASVVLTARWTTYVANDTFKSNLVATVRSLLDLGIKVYVVKDVPYPGYDAPRFAALTVRQHGDISQLGITQKIYEQRNRQLVLVFQQIAKLGVPVLDPTPYFLNDDGLYGVENDGEILYTDGDHLSVFGAIILAPMFEPIFRTE